MKNILSYKLGSVFSGKEIKEWINYHLENKTSHTKQALYLKRFLNINDENHYMLYKDGYPSSETYNEYYFKKID